MNRTFRVSAATQSQTNVGLGFAARSVVVDNPTTAWVFIPEVSQYVPPLTVGKVVPYLYGTQTPAMQVVAAPPGINSVTPVGLITFNFTDEQLAPLPGTVITNPTVPAAASSIIVARITENAAASPQTITLPTSLALDGDVMYLLVAQDSGGGAAPTLVTPTDWSIPASAPAITFTNGARQERYALYTKVFHPGITSAVLTFTNTLNFIWTFIIVRPVPQATMTDNPGSASAVVAAAAFALPGRALTVGNGQGIVLYAPVAIQAAPVSLLTAALTGGQTGLTAAIATLVGATQTQSLFLLQETVLELCPTATFTYSGNFAQAGGFCIPIPHA